MLASLFWGAARSRCRAIFASGSRSLLTHFGVRQGPNVGFPPRSLTPPNTWEPEQRHMRENASESELALFGMFAPFLRKWILVACALSTFLAVSGVYADAFAGKILIQHLAKKPSKFLGRQAKSGFHDPHISRLQRTLGDYSKAVLFDARQQTFSGKARVHCREGAAISKRVG